MKMFNSEQIILKLRQWASRLFGLSDGVFYMRLRNKQKEKRKR